MNMREITFAAALLAGALTASAAQARGAVDVQWQVTIGSPQMHLPGGGVVLLPPVPLPRVVVAPRREVVYAEPRYGDADRDGIPNRYDRTPRGGHPGYGYPVYGHRDWREDRRDDRRDWREDRRDDRKDWRDDRRGRGGRDD